METFMKNFLIFGLAVLSLQGAMADDRRPDRDPRRPEPQGPQGPQGPGRGMDIVMCLKTLDNTQRDLSRAQNDLDMCRRTSVDPREVDQLRRDNTALNIDNANLRNENADLRRRLDEMRPPRQTEFFSYAGCTDRYGTIDLKYISSGSGFLPIEAEANSLKSTQTAFSCSFGTKVVKTEEIVYNQPVKYCTAACTDRYGTPDARYSVGVRGRNETEATFTALQKVQKEYACTFAPKVTACQ
jgi:hypothetical protein